MKKICVIPARMGSSRFPGKPLKKIQGVPMVIHIAKRCQLSKDLDTVIVATCDNDIVEVCDKYKVPSMITSSSHERCTDRVSEAMSKYEKELQAQDLILMVQGDEALVTSEMLDSVIQEYEKNSPPIVNLLSQIYKQEDYEDNNVVKVVASPDCQALYFSRAPIPSRYRDKKAPSYQQTGVIGFSYEFLQTFSSLSQTPLEKIESIDMLRVLEHHLPLKVVYTEKETVAVDMPYDLKRVCEIIEKDKRVNEYA